MTTVARKLKEKFGIAKISEKGFPEQSDWKKLLPLAFLGVMGTQLTHLCPPLRSTFAVRETQSLGQQMLNATVGINGLIRSP